MPADANSALGAIPAMGMPTATAAGKGSGRIMALAMAKAKHRITTATTPAFPIV
jgi:hypothetical protein